MGVRSRPSYCASSARGLLRHHPDRVSNGIIGWEPKIVKMKLKKCTGWLGGKEYYRVFSTSSRNFPARPGYVSGEALAAGKVRGSPYPGWASPYEAEEKTSFDSPAEEVSSVV